MTTSCIPPTPCRAHLSSSCRLHRGKRQPAPCAHNGFASVHTKGVTSHFKTRTRSSTRQTKRHTLTFSSSNNDQGRRNLLRTPAIQPYPHEQRTCPAKRKHGRIRAGAECTRLTSQLGAAHSELA
eukprot:3005492-Rhodomonas_salina.1